MFYKKILFIIFFFKLQHLSSQFISIHSELFRSDSLIAYAKNFEGILYLDYKSYNMDTLGIEGDSFLIYHLGASEPTWIDISKYSYFRGRRPYMFLSDLIDFSTGKKVSSIVGKVDFESDSLIEIKYTNFNTLNAYEQYFYDKGYQDWNSFNLLYPNRDTAFYRTLSFKDNKPDLLFQYDTIIGVNPKVWYKSYTEKYYYKNQLLDSIVRTQYNPDGSTWVVFPEKYFRDQKERLYYVKLYVINDPLSSEQELLGYINVYGGIVPDNVQENRKKTEYKLYSVADKIKWDQDLILNQNSLVLIHSLDGRYVRALPIDQTEQSCTWPSSIPFGCYYVQIIAKNEILSNILMKSP